MDKLQKKLAAVDSDDDENKELPPIKLQGYIYAWGKNKDGELSVGHNKNCLLPTPVRGVKDKVITYLASGGQHSSTITENGIMMVVGSSLHNKLGIEDLNLTFINTFQIVPQLKNHIVKQVACGEFHTLALLESGVVYTWGGSLHKKLGQSSTKPGPIPNLMEKKIVAVDCGDFHSVALTEKGEVYAWGGGGSHYNKGQCGHGHYNDVEQPELVKFFKGKPVQKVSCGGYHTMALLTTGELFGWGSGGYGECGFGEFVDAPLPRKVNINTNQRYYQEVANELLNDDDGDTTPHILEISCGGHHSMILTDKGVFVCGYASHGQLGLKGTVNQADPQFVYTLSNKKIVQIAAGWNHSLALTDTMDIYATGHGLSGQLGLGTDESKTAFTHVSTLRGKNISRIFAGGNHSWIILDYNEPINENYAPPSPLRSYASTPITGKSREPSPLNSRMKIDRVDDESFYQKQEKVIQVVYTDNEMSHRFIRFMVPEHIGEAFQTRLEEYIKDMYSFEVGIQFHKLQLDTEVIEEVNGFGKLISPTTKKNTKAYTLMFVCDLKKNAMETNPFSKRTTPSFQMVNTIIGEMHLLKESDLRKDEIQRYLCHWMLVFTERFSDIASSMKFMELRPTIYSQ